MPISTFTNVGFRYSESTGPFSPDELVTPTKEFFNAGTFNVTRYISGYSVSPIFRDIYIFDVPIGREVTRSFPYTLLQSIAIDGTKNPITNVTVTDKANASLLGSLDLSSVIEFKTDVSKWSGSYARFWCIPNNDIPIIDVYVNFKRLSDRSTSNNIISFSYETSILNHASTGVDRFVDLVDVSYPPVPATGAIPHFNASSGLFEQANEVNVDPISRSINLVTEGGIGLVNNSGTDPIVVQAGGEVVVQAGTNVTLAPQNNFIVNASAGVVDVNASVLDVDTTGVIDINSSGGAVSISAPVGALTCEGNSISLDTTGGEVDVRRDGSTILTTTSTTTTLLGDLGVRLVPTGAGSIAELVPQSDVNSYASIATDNKTAAQYALDIAIRDDAIPNKVYVDNAVAGVDLSTKVTKGGDSDGVPLVIGTNDAQPLSLETGGITRMTASDTGAITINSAGGFNLTETIGGATVNITSGKGTTLTSDNNRLQTPGGTSSVIVTQGIDINCAPGEITTVNGGAELQLGVTATDGIIYLNPQSDITSVVKVAKDPMQYAISCATDDSIVPNVYYVKEGLSTKLTKDGDPEAVVTMGSTDVAGVVNIKAGNFDVMKYAYIGGKTVEVSVESNYNQRIRTADDLDRDIIIETGRTTTAANTGGVIVTSGANTSTSGRSGTVRFISGASTLESGDVDVVSGRSLNDISGKVNIESGLGVLGSGETLIRTGQSETPGIPSGNTIISTGSRIAGAEVGSITGNTLITTGTANGLAVTTGDVLVSTGLTGTDNSTSGSVNISTGVSTTTGNGRSGGVKLTTGECAGTLSNTGDVSISTGDNTNINGSTGSLIISTGACPTVVNRGSIEVDARNVTVDADGNITLNSTTGLVLASGAAINFNSGGITAPKLALAADGTLESLVTNYETLVTQPNDMTNKKYVDDQIGAIPAGSLVTLSDTAIVAPEGEYQFLRRDADGDWKNSRIRAQNTDVIQGLPIDVPTNIGETVMDQTTNAMVHQGQDGLTLYYPLTTKAFGAVQTGISYPTTIDTLSPVDWFQNDVYNGLGILPGSFNNGSLAAAGWTNSAPLGANITSESFVNGGGFSDVKGDEPTLFIPFNYPTSSGPNAIRSLFRTSGTNSTNPKDYIDFPLRNTVLSDHTIFLTGVLLGNVSVDSGDPEQSISLINGTGDTARIVVLVQTSVNPNASLRSYINNAGTTLDYPLSAFQTFTAPNDYVNYCSMVVTVDSTTKDIVVTTYTRDWSTLLATTTIPNPGATNPASATAIRIGEYTKRVQVGFVEYLHFNSLLSPSQIADVIQATRYGMNIEPSGPGGFTIHSMEIAETPASNDLIKYDGTKFINSQVGLNDLAGVSVTGAVANQPLVFNGANWVPSTLMSGAVNDEVVLSSFGTGSVELSAQGTGNASILSLDPASQVNVNTLIIPNSGVARATSNSNTLMVTEGNTSTGIVTKDYHTKSLGAHILDTLTVAPTAGDILRYDGSQWVNYKPPAFYGYWDDNATSSLGVQNNINWMQGTYITTVNIGFTIGANNGFIYSGVSRIFEVEYDATPIVGSNDRTIWLTAYKNPDAILNPNVSGLISGSRAVSTLRTAIEDTDGMSGRFTVELTGGDVLRFYVSNKENNDAIVVTDWRLKIKAIY